MAERGDNIFVYLGGEQVVPQDVRRIIIDRSVKIIPDRAFAGRERLISVEMHEGIEIVGSWAFSRCHSLRKIKLLGVREVERGAFHTCVSLNVEFGEKLEIIRSGAFGFGPSLQKIKLPSVRTVESGAFGACRQLTDVEFGGNLETIQYHAFHSCPLLRRIAVPLKDDIFPLHPTDHQYTRLFTAAI
mmetsp:Transcript_19122/g.28871  ORF Transcript_19122/g.28871 Transcript_19122/m.28871 type:complete len:187 (+) Transcript_19122:116-676(+)